MCWTNQGRGGGLPQPAPVTPAPTRDSVVAPVNPVTLVEENKAITAARQGIFGNITTTPLGDASFGTASFAKFGKKVA